jgi:very-short-patch-repair endonuclease
MIPRLRRRRALPDEETLRLLADERREHPTRAERALAAILCELNGGALDGRFRREWVCGRWIVDFYFPEVRLAVEIDGGYHRSTTQKGWDHFKEGGLEASGVTLLRLTNEEVFGDRLLLRRKLREAWRRASREARRTASPGAITRANAGERG